MILIAETGLLIGIVLPGDSLLFTAGLLCATSRSGVHLSLPLVLGCSIAGALLGAQIGYLLGRKAGSAWGGPTTRASVRTAADRAQRWLQRYGPAKAIVLARFVPGVRTVINPVAGFVHVQPRTFTAAQVGGGLVWTVGVVLAGYALGSRIPSIDTYLLPIIAGVVVLSLIPIAIEVLRSWRRARRQQSRQPGSSAEDPAQPSTEL